MRAVNLSGVASIVTAVGGFIAGVRCGSGGAAAVGYNNSMPNYGDFWGPADSQSAFSLNVGDTCFHLLPLSVFRWRYETRCPWVNGIPDENGTYGMCA